MTGAEMLDELARRAELLWCAEDDKERLAAEDRLDALRDAIAALIDAGRGCYEWACQLEHVHVSSQTCPICKVLDAWTDALDRCEAAMGRER